MFSTALPRRRTALLLSLLLSPASPALPREQSAAACPPERECRREALRRRRRERPLTSQPALTSLAVVVVSVLWPRRMPPLRSSRSWSLRGTRAIASPRTAPAFSFSPVHTSSARTSSTALSRRLVFSAVFAPMGLL